MPTLNLRDIFTQDAVDEYLEENPPKQLLGPSLFPAVDVDDIKFEFYKGGDNKTAMGHVQAFNGEAHTSGREGAEKYIERMDPIKEKIALEEDLYYKFVKGQSPRRIVRALFDDVGNMYNSVRYRIEKMRMDAIAEGVITIDDNGYKRTIDLLIPDNQKATITTTEDKWSDLANSTPIEDILTWLKQIDNPGRILTSDTVLTYLLRNQNVRAEIFNDSNTTQRLTQDILNEYFNTLNIPPVATYDEKVYKYSSNGSKTKVRLFPENKFVVLPSDPVGETQQTETVESMKGTNVVRTDDMIAVKQWEKDEPEAIWTKAAAIQFPVIQNHDDIFQAQPID